MLTITCDKYTGNTCPAQIYNSGWECAFASRKTDGKGYYQANRWVFCKDFLNEIVWSNLFHKPCCVYSLPYDPAEFPVALDRVRVLVREKNTPNKQFEEECVKARGMLREFDSLFGFRNTVLKRVNMEDTAVFLFEGDGRWLKSPQLLSLFSLVCRAGRYWDESYKGKLKEFVQKFVDGEVDMSKAPQSSERAINNDKKYLKTFLFSGGFDKFVGQDKTIFYTRKKLNYSVAPGMLPGTIPTPHQIHYAGIVNFSENGFPSLKKG